MRPLPAQALAVTLEWLGQRATRVRLLRCASVGESVRALGRIWIHGGGVVRVGNRVVLDGRSAPIELHVERGGEIVLGDDVHLEGGVSLEALLGIEIGERSRLGNFVKVLDNDFHPTTGDRHKRPPSVKVVVEPDVEIGARAILLPGARLGRGAKVAAGAVVSRKVPAGAAVEGSPLRVQTPRG